jgi:enoyl-CoA hydratase/carnithine racemase
MFVLKKSLDARGVLWVTLNRPDKRNALNRPLVQALREVFEVEVLDPRVRVVVLQGEGKVFCAGVDLQWTRNACHLEEEANEEEVKFFADLFLKMSQCLKPLVGVVHGAVLGGGIGLLSVCDLAIAVEQTTFAFTEVRLGLVPACITPFVLAKIGFSHARALFLTGTSFDTRRASWMGLIHAEVPASERSEVVSRCIHDLLQAGPRALEAVKTLLASPSLTYLESCSRVFARLRVSEEAKEGMDCFLRKKKPSWVLS